jgi:hypothetical protein
LELKVLNIRGLYSVRKEEFDEREKTYEALSEFNTNMAI